MTKYTFNEQPISNEQMWAAFFRYCKKIGTFEDVCSQLKLRISFGLVKSMFEVNPIKMVSPLTKYNYARFFSVFSTEHVDLCVKKFEAFLEERNLYNIFCTNFQKSQPWIHNDTMKLSFTSQLKFFMSMYCPSHVIANAFCWGDTPQGSELWQRASREWDEIYRSSENTNSIMFHN